jgi:WD40 repeat protein
MNVPNPGQVLKDVALSPDGQFLAALATPARASSSSDRDRVLKLWKRAGDSFLLGAVVPTPTDTQIVFAPDSRRLVVRDFNNSVVVRDAETGHARFTVRGRFTKARDVTFSPDGRWLALVCAGQPVRVFPADERLEAQQLFPLPAWEIAALAPDGRFSAVRDGARTVLVRDGTTGRTLHRLTDHPSFVAHLAFSPDGRLLACVSDNREVRIWDTRTGAIRGTLAAPPLTTPVVPGAKFGSWVSAFSPDGGALALVSSDKVVRVWQVSGEQVKPRAEWKTEILSALAFSADGRWLAGVGLSRACQIWDTADGREHGKLPAPGPDPFLQVAFSPREPLVALGGLDGSVRLWTWPAGPVVLLGGHTRFIASLAFSPDGRRLVTAGDDQALRVWDVDTHRELLTMAEDASAVNFTPDGTGLLTRAPGGSVKLRDGSPLPAVNTE